MSQSVPTTHAVNGTPPDQVYLGGDLKPQLHQTPDDPEDPEWLVWQHEQEEEAMKDEILRQAWLAEARVMENLPFTEEEEQIGAEGLWDLEREPFEFFDYYEHFGVRNEGQLEAAMNSI